MLKRSSPWFTLFMLAVDLMLTVLAAVIAYELRSLLPIRQESAALSILDLETAATLLGLILLIWTLILSLGSVYDPRRTLRVGDELQVVTTAVLFACFVLAGVLYLSLREVSRVWFIYFCAVNLLLLIGWRFLLRLLVRGLNLTWHVKEQRILVIGAGLVGQRVAQMLMNHRTSGIHVVGFLDDNPAKLHRQWDGVAVIGPSSAVQEVVAQHKIDAVVFALPLRAHQRMIELIYAMKHLPVRIYVVPDMFDLAFFVNIDQLYGVPLIGLREPAIDGYQRFVKRAFDLLVSTCVLVFLSPLLCVIAIAIKLDSPGSVIFKQQRVGENGQFFWMYKFRSMCQNAEQRRAEVVTVLPDGAIHHKRRDDPRVTRVGRFLRATSLDELPQFINVLKGEMSLVGPRPEMPALVECYEFWQRRRFAVPQGITGWWQVNGRSDKPMHLHTMEDLYYIQNYSLWLDIRILWMTVGAVLKRKGAY